MNYTQYDNNDMYKITVFCGKRLGAKHYFFACKKWAKPWHVQKMTIVRR